MRIANPNSMPSASDLMLFAQAQVRRRHWDWRHLIGAIVLTAIGVWVRWADWKDVWNIFTRDEEASHVILTPFVVACLVWVRRERLRRITLRTSWLGPLIVAAGCGICYFGDGHGYQALRHFGAVTIAVGCIVTMLGRELLVNFLPAFAALAFLIPMPPMFRQKISLPMMPFTAAVTQDIMGVLGMDVQRTGNQLLVNGKQVLIAEACNGLRLFFPIIMVVYLVAFFVSLKFYVRMLMVALSPVAAILCNIIRLIPTVWIIGYGNEEFAHDFHDLAGWAMLAIAFVLLYSIVWVLRWALVPVSPFTLARD
ncbi:MAG TPA: exosortase/archaeosortase family protein [Phycisphaerae bacterium]|jgi:exosortase|nr:exosortase/archaeosortase family protein [Phycisphaerae bacterium]